MRRKRLTIRFLQSGEVTWSSPSGQKQDTRRVAENDVVKGFVDVLLHVPDTFRITDSGGWYIDLPSEAFESPVKQ